jgi:hypothetical protein
VAEFGIPGGHLCGSRTAQGAIFTFLTFDGKVAFSGVIVSFHKPKGYFIIEEDDKAYTVKTQGNPDVRQALDYIHQAWTKNYGKFSMCNDELIEREEDKYGNVFPQVR